MKKSNKTKFITAQARISGFCEYENLHGSISFKQLPNGVLATAEVYNLPHKENGNVLGFHIHSGTSCSNDGDDTLGHFNPEGTFHPYHAGDMPPLFENDGYAYLSFFTNRFSVNEIIGKVVIIHSEPDDFTTQPGGNSGEKIACGKILYLG